VGLPGAALLQALGLGEEELAALFSSVAPGEGRQADGAANPQVTPSAGERAEAAQPSSSDAMATSADGEVEEVQPREPRSPGLWQHGRLPQDPVQLLQWLDGLEQALARRLRNLSHAINIALLRSGLSGGLLPVSLLDAVLQGQIETLSAPSNLLRLQLPFGPRPGAPPLQAWAVLLRPVDLEMEEPRLRTCRRRLQQQRQELRRMAQHFRRLQRRLQAREAERLWLQDTRRSNQAPL
jgi:hypothetical protein